MHAHIVLLIITDRKEDNDMKQTMLLHEVIILSWWRHDMGMLSTLLALWDRNMQSSEGWAMRGSGVSLLLLLISCLTNSRCHWFGMWTGHCDGFGMMLMVLDLITSCHGQGQGFGGRDVGARARTMVVLSSKVGQLDSGQVAVEHTGYLGVRTGSYSG